MDPDSAPVARVQLEHAGCLLEHGRRAEAAALVEEARAAILAAGPAGAALQPAVRALQEKLGTPAEGGSGQAGPARVRLGSRRPPGQMAELVDALDLGSSPERGPSSTLGLPTAVRRSGSKAAER